MPEVSLVENISDFNKAQIFRHLIFYNIISPLQFVLDYEGMEKLLSSKLTYFYKRVFPAMWIITFGAGTLFLWIYNCEGTSLFKWFVLVCLLGGSIFLRWFSEKLKVVSLQGEQLVVSDYRSEETIPLRQIEEVTETRIWNPKLIKLRLNRPGRWGDEIVFIAPIRFQFIFLNHPLVKELRHMIQTTQRGS